MHVAAVIRMVNFLPNDQFTRLLNVSSKTDTVKVKDDFISYIRTFLEKDPNRFTDWFEAWMIYRDSDSFEIIKSTQLVGGQERR